MIRYKETKIVSILSILGNLFLLIIKGIIAFITGSQAMIADTFNSASDIFNSIMTFIGNKISSKEADNDHNLGHGKAEYIYSMIISLTMMFLGIKILYNAILSIIEGSSYNFNYFLIVVCIITIIVKLSLYIYTNKISKRNNNLLIKAVSIDHRNDIFVTLFNLISIILTYLGIKYIDGIVGSLISLWIIYNGFLIFKESYDILMDKTISLETKEKVLNIIKNYPDIVKINHFNATPVGYRYYVSFSIFVDGNLSTYDSHEIANKLEKEISKKIDEIYLTVIHVNPIDIKKNNK